MTSGTAPPGLVDAPAVRGDRRVDADLWRRWAVTTTGAELAGFLLPALAAVLAGNTLDGLGGFTRMVLAGAGEGAVLGWAQGRVLQRVLPDLSTRDWTWRTSVAAALAWAIGMAPSSLGDAFTELPTGTQVVVTTPAGVVLLLSIGVAQWTVLRRHVPGASRWIGWTALGWCIGLGTFLAVATPLWQPGQSTALVAGIGVLAGSLMAGTMAVVTGWGLVRLLRRTPAPRARVRSAARPVPEPWELSGRQVAADLRVDPGVGLDARTTAARFAADGPNEVQTRRQVSLAQSVIARLRDPLILVLVGRARSPRPPATSSTAPGGGRRPARASRRARGGGRRMTVAGRPPRHPGRGVGTMPDQRGGTVAQVHDWSEVVEAATRAPSIHNTQPWRFTATADRLAVRFDPVRLLPVLDPTHRQQVISCGAAVEFAAVAMRARGRDVAVDVVPEPGDPDHLATVRVVGERTADDEDRALAAAIAERHTTRAPFLPRQVPAELIDRLQDEAGQYGVWVVNVSREDAELVTVFLLGRAEEAEQGDAAYLAELQAWLRTDPDAVDGVPVSAVPGGDPAARPSNWLIRDFLAGQRTAQPPAAVADDDPPPTVERPAVLLMGTMGDDRAAWVQAGRALGRLLLRLTAAGLAASPLTQALDWPATRTRLRVELSLVGHPQMLLRLGWPSTAAPQTGRRPVAEVLRTIE